MVLSFNLTAFGQKTGSSQTSGLNSPVNYEATDSIVADVKSQIVRLYGNAHVQYEGIDLEAELIEIDLINNEVIATYGLDSIGQPFGKPHFSAEGEESTSDYIKYNFKSKKGFVKEVRMQQGEGYIHMAESKVHPNEEIHFKHGKFTTCDKEKPHFHFALSRAIVVPEKRIITGPLYMEILRVPTPLAAPFGFFPNSDKKQAGLILPEPSLTRQYGFGLVGLGYYFPIGEYWETTFLGSAFTTGRWSLENTTNYFKKYKSRGNFGLRFEQLKGRFYDPEISRKWTIEWTHNQDRKAHPSLTFTSNVRFISDNTAKTTLDVINPNFFDNTFNSSAKVTKNWKLNRFNGIMALQTSLRQNTSTKNYVIELPSYSFSVTRFDLGVLRKQPIGKKWYENISVNYDLRSVNSITAPDSIFNFDDFNQIRDYATNGVEQITKVQSNLKVFGSRFLFNPSATYREIWNFQSEDRVWNPDAEKVDTTEIDGFRAARDLSFAGAINFNFYGYYKFKGKKGLKFRHWANPDLSFNYRPDLGLHEEIQTNIDGTTQFYSPFARSFYKEKRQGSSGTLSFGVNNVLEMKVRDKNDTINNSMKALKLVETFSIRSGYDFLKDSLNLSDFQLAFRTANFLNIFSFQTNGTWSPYGWDAITGIENSNYAWNDGKELGRLDFGRIVLNANFSSNRRDKKSKNIAEQTLENEPVLEENGTPKLDNFTIPWDLNIAYNLNYNQASLRDESNELVDSFRIVQTISGIGKFNFNDKWKLNYEVNLDLQTRKISNFNIGLWRDLHCWETSLLFQQIGPIFNPNPDQAFSANWSILFKIGVKASMFRDIKYEQNLQNPFPL